MPNDSKTFEGMWAMVSAREDGVERDGEYREQSRLAVEGDRHTVSLGGVTQSARHRLNPSTTPKAIDIVWDDDTTFFAIYELTDTMFRICLGAPGTPRPEDFSSTPGSGRMLHQWKRDTF